MKVYPLEPIQETFYSYLGAQGSDATYTFPQYFPELPKCSEVTGYTIINQSPPGLLTYPADNCQSIPCLEVGIDTAVSQDITF